MRLRLVWFATLLLLAMCEAASAQQSASSAMVGQVVDSTGASVPGAMVTATNLGTGAARTTVTDPEGRFSIPALNAATYSLTVELEGFQTATIPAVVLRAGETVRPNLTLGVAGINEDVSVQAEAPLLQTANATVASVINEKVLADVPIAGRTLLNVTTLTPGVTARDFDRGTFFGRRDQYVTVEGGRDSSTNYAIDGVYVRSLRWNNMSLNPAIDSIQEVNVLRNSFSTEYGQGQAVVSMVTKSGSNQFSGTASEYFRNDALNARNYFATSKPTYERNQYGATSGGPLIKNRTFAFGAFEGLREERGEVNFATVPSPSWLRGDFSDIAAPILDPLTGSPFPGNQIPQARISQFAAVQLDAIPTANTSGASGNYRSVHNFTDDTDTFTIRLDHVLASNHNLFGRYIWYDSLQVIPGAIADTGRPQTGRNLALGHTWVISPQLVNEFRVGYNHAFHSGDALFGGEDPRSRNWVADTGLQNLYGGEAEEYYGRPGATIQGFGGVVPATGVQPGATDRIFSISNATSKVAGAHTFRFGFQAEHREVFMTTTTGARGGFTFNGRSTGVTNSAPHAVADFLLGYCSSCTGTFGSSDSTYRSITFAPFIDDVWQVNRKLTLQLGLRWEYVAPWQEVNDIEGTFDPASGMIGFHKVPANIPPSLAPLIIAQDDFYPAGIVEKDLNNFGPRLGAVYNISDRTVVRAGFGIYFDNLNLNELQFTRLVPPFTGRFDLSPTGTALVNVGELFPDPQLVTSFPTPFAMDPENVTASVRQWNVNVQQSIGAGLVVEAAYTGSRSQNEHKRFNLNQPREGTAPQAERLPYPRFAPGILTSSDTGHGEFHGVSFRVDKRFSQGLFFNGSYQFSRNRDNNSGEIEANDTAFAWDHEADWALSRYDRTHRSAIAFGYELPWGEGRRWLSGSGPLQYLLGNWQVAGAVRIQSGIPFTVGVSPLQTLGSFVPARADFAPGREEDRGALDDASPTRWFDVSAYVVPSAGFQGRAGRNTLRGPGFRKTDVSFSKRFPFGNTKRLEFRAEIYNLFNNTNFGLPGTNISNPTAGVITTADEARSMQFGAKFVW